MAWRKHTDPASHPAKMAVLATGSVASVSIGREGSAESLMSRNTGRMCQADWKLPNRTPIPRKSRSIWNLSTFVWVKVCVWVPHLALPDILLAWRMPITKAKPLAATANALVSWETESWRKGVACFHPKGVLGVEANSGKGAMRWLSCCGNIAIATGCCKDGSIAANRTQSNWFNGDVFVFLTWKHGILPEDLLFCHQSFVVGLSFCLEGNQVWFSDLIFEKNEWYLTEATKVTKVTKDKFPGDERWRRAMTSTIRFVAWNLHVIFFYQSGHQPQQCWENAMQWLEGRLIFFSAGICMPLPDLLEEAKKESEIKTPSWDSDFRRTASSDWSGANPLAFAQGRTLHISSYIYTNIHLLRHNIYIYIIYIIIYI